MCLIFFCNIILDFLFHFIFLIQSLNKKVGKRKYSILTLQIFVIDSTADDRFMNTQDGCSGSLKECVQVAGTVLKEILLMFYDQFSKRK